MRRASCGVLQLVNTSERDEEADTPKERVDFNGGGGDMIRICLFSRGDVSHYKWTHGSPVTLCRCYVAFGHFSAMDSPFVLCSCFFLRRNYFLPLIPLFHLSRKPVLLMHLGLIFAAWVVTGRCRSTNLYLRGHRCNTACRSGRATTAFPRRT